MIALRFAYLFLLLVLASPLRGTPLSAAQVSQLDRYRAEVIAAVRTGTADTLAPMQDEGLRLMPAYQLTVLGKDNAALYYRAFFQRFVVGEYERQVEERLDLGAQVAEFGRYTMSLSVREGGKTLMVAGKYLELWRKRRDGSLALLTAVWCHDQPPQEPELFRFATVPGVRIAHERELSLDHPLRFELSALNTLEEIAISQRDAKTWSQFFADDAVIYANLGPIANGRAAVDDYVSGHVQHLPVFEHLDVRTDRVDASGEYFIVYASHVANWRAGDASGVNTGKNLKICRREPAGMLKIVRAIGCYD
jgi:ketosteroid isomerase-like protein